MKDNNKIKFLTTNNFFLNCYILISFILGIISVYFFSIFIFNEYGKNYIPIILSSIFVYFTVLSFSSLILDRLHYFLIEKNNHNRLLKIGI